LYIEDANKKYPSFPKDYIPAPKYNEKGANALTKCVIDFLIFNGWQAERISSTGRYVDNTKVVTDVIGRQRTIGSGKWIKGSSTKGTADISATIKGKSIKIEIKYGKDRQSQEQMRYQLAIEKAGGVYLIVRDFDSFVEWYDKFTSND
jgi:hypothetical protein